ncbi:MAG: hypothetical protein ABJF11_18590 [Reichenbachiella sp.]|uniref:hypothetical protein n=1 Tax=Reichenbachiella sp. TaxID=2184521 RepID=UPI00326623E1
MKQILLLLGVCIALQSYGQSDSLQLDSQGQSRKLYGYIGGVVENALVDSEQTTSIGLQAAVILKRHWQLGMYGTSHTSNSFREQLIFPNFFQMNYKHAGVLVGYRTHLEKKFEFNLESKIGWGEVKWNQVDSGQPFLADRIGIVQLQGSVDLILTDFLVINGFAGYRWMNGLAITGLENDDFEGINYGLVAKIGIFR